MFGSHLGTCSAALDHNTECTRSSAFDKGLTTSSERNIRSGRGPSAVSVVFGVAAAARDTATVKGGGKDLIPRATNSRHG